MSEAIDLQAIEVRANAATANSAFIAAARADVPALLAEVRRLTEALTNVATENIVLAAKNRLLRQSLSASQAELAESRNARVDPLAAAVLAAAVEWRRLQNLCEDTHDAYSMDGAISFDWVKAGVALEMADDALRVAIDTYTNALAYQSGGLAAFPRE